MWSLALQENLSLKMLQKTAEVLSPLDVMKRLVTAGLEAWPLFNRWRLFPGPLCLLCLQQVCMK